MDARNKVKNIFSYLLSVKNANSKSIRNFEDYDKVYFESDLCHMGGCTYNRDLNKDWWLHINRKAKALYDQFFRLYQDIQKRGEDFEIIWGSGVLVWEYNGEKIIHPMFTTKMELDFNAREGQFSLKPFGRTDMEIFFLEGLGIPNMDKLNELKESVKTLNVDPRNIEELQEILIQITHYLSANINLDGEVHKNMISINNVKFTDCPVFYNCPSLIIRRSDTSLWDREIKNIIEFIDNGGEIPNTIRAMVEDEELINERDEALEWSKLSKELLFPLPANTEQKEIIKRISENYGVVVQGPPGTGKSHTIVNLVCHLLANGKRVLVTSQTDRALKVLSNMIPEEIKPLCISFLGNDTKSIKELEDSVSKITDNLSLNPESLERQIIPLEHELKTCRKTQAELYKKIKIIEEEENSSIVYFGKNYKLIDMARWVTENKDKYSWIKDNISIDINIPIKEADFYELARLLSCTSKEDIKKINKISGMLDKLPSYEEIYLKQDRMREVSKAYKDCRETVEGWYVPENPRCDYDKVISVVKEAESSLYAIEKSTFAKIMEYNYTSEIVHENLSAMVYKANICLKKIKFLGRELSGYNVEIPKIIDIEKVYADFKILYNIFDLKGKISGLYKFTHNKLNYLLEECKVDNKEIENIQTAQVVMNYLEYKMNIKELKNLWNNSIKELGGRVIAADTADIAMILENYVNKTMDILNWDKEYKEKIIRGLGLIRLPKNMEWYKSQNYSEIMDGIRSIKVIDEYENLKASLETYKKLIAVIGELDDLYEGINEGDTLKVKKAYDYINRLMSIRRDVDYINRMSLKIREVCPLFENEIINATDFNKYKEWAKAWRWKQWDRILKDREDSNIDKTYMLFENQKELEKSLIQDIVSKKTWYNQINRISEFEKRSLVSWVQAVKRVGKGTGKYSPEYRKIAQNEMENCKDVIPVWIMPLNKVIENINLSEKLFDVIIFDESSQCDIYSLCGLMRAKRAVIVGDDRQISPEAVGIEQSKVKDLINNYLGEIPNKEWFDLQTSLYDTAIRVFPNRLMLKEHFRCVPEIIQFSNKFCYSGSIIPLRYPKNHEMFNPPIVAIKVSNAIREDKKALNIVEAEAIISQIKECVSNPRYNGMNMGVISLLGESQAEYIENRLRETIGEEEMVNRKLICGDAYSFQGDERDLIFLSLVIANNIKFTALTKDSDIRRFNVAASRAKNQMWIYHSVDLDDLSLDCVRYSLLSYCLNYNKYNEEVETIQYIFHSELRKDVYKSIKDECYKVVPDVKIGSYKIDFVIEGERNRLGIICDGDELTILSSWEQSFVRQMELQKVGWSFFRVRASEFYYNKERLMGELIKKLNSMNIISSNLDVEFLEEVKFA